MTAIVPTHDLVLAMPNRGRWRLCYVLRLPADRMVRRCLLAFMKKRTYSTRQFDQYVKTAHI